MAVERFKFTRKMLFLWAVKTIGCWYLRIELIIHWSLFLTEKSELKDVMIVLTKDVKATQSITVRCVNCGMLVRKKPLTG